METRSLLRQIMGYSMTFGFLILLAVATNGEENATTQPPDKSLPHPTVAANESSQNAVTSEAIHTSTENGKNKTSGEMYSAALKPLSKELTAAAKRPPNATISTTERSPGKKPGQAKGEGEMRESPKSDERNSTQTHGNRGCGADCRPSPTTPAATAGSGGLTASLGIIMAVVLSLLLCF